MRLYYLVFFSLFKVEFFTCLLVEMLNYCPVLWILIEFYLHSTTFICSRIFACRTRSHFGDSMMAHRNSAQKQPSSNYPKNNSPTYPGIAGPTKPKPEAISSSNGSGKDKCGAGNSDGWRHSLHQRMDARQLSLVSKNIRLDYGDWVLGRGAGDRYSAEVAEKMGFAKAKGEGRANKVGWKKICGAWRRWISSFMDN